MRGPEELWPSRIDDLAIPSIESLLLEAGALRHGQSTLRLRSDTFIAESGDGTRVGFQGMLSSSTSHAAVAACANRLRLSTRLEQFGLPVSPARSFRVADLRSATAYAKSLGAGASIQLADRTLLAESTLLIDGPDFRTDTAHWSKRLPPETPILVRERPVGQDYCFYVVGGQVISVIQPSPESPAGSEIYRCTRQESADPASAAIHPDVLDLALRAVAALPPAPHAVVTLTCPTLTESAVGCTVAAVDATLGVAGEGQPEEWSAFVVDQIIEHATDGSGVPPGEAQGRIRAALELVGVLDVPATQRALAEWASSARLTCDVDAGRSDAAGGTFAGTPGELALLSVLLLAGRLTEEAPETVAWIPAADRTL